jgi:outer membrane cobalamin receptor
VTVRSTAWDIAARTNADAGRERYCQSRQQFPGANVNDNYNLFAATVNLLEPQTSHDAEIGLEGNAGNLRYRAAAYRIDLRNEIFFDPLTSAIETCSQRGVRDWNWKRAGR